jgi:hypothetical protein
LEEYLEIQGIEKGSHDARIWDVRIDGGAGGYGW